jgi:predicted acylesterase/phospholipase RssA
MKIDTLILSGGGPSGMAYFGMFKALFEKKIIDPKLKGIQEIITTSVGIIPSIFFMLGIPIHLGEEIVMKYDIKNMIDGSNISLDDLLIDFGLFKTDGVYNLLLCVIKNYCKKDDFTLIELYEKTKIKLTVKVFNTTLKLIQYISHETDPELSLLKLSQMTTAIPFFFKPVMYNDEYYVDGGMRGHFPIEVCKSKNYLGLFITGGSVNHESELMKMFPILEFMYSLIISQDKIVYDIKKNKSDKRIIFNSVDYGLNFDMPNEDKIKIINEGYNKTISHLKKHLEINKV